MIRLLQPLIRQGVLPLCLLLLISFSVNAHGPGRSVRVQMGYCDEAGAVTRSLTSEVMALDQESPFCFRITSLEPFPMAVLLEMLPGRTKQSGTDVCSMGLGPPSQVPQFGQHEPTPGYFIREEEQCRFASLVLPPGETLETRGGWLYQPPAGAQKMVSCIMARAYPLDMTGELHLQGIHIKGRRSLHMGRLLGPAGDSGVTHLPEWSGNDSACDPATPVQRLMAESEREPVQQQGNAILSTGPRETIHPGLSGAWLITAISGLLLVSIWGVGRGSESRQRVTSRPLVELPVLSLLARALGHSPWPLVLLRLLSMAFFLLLLYAGFKGALQADMNLATVVAWNLWWPLVIFSVLVVGTGWCAICPWDGWATLLARWRLLRMRHAEIGLNFKLPRSLRNLYPALLLLLGFTWLELGYAATSSPPLTAGMALFLLLLAILFQWLFERKAFCRYWCPVGRTLGVYSRLSPVAIRPIDQQRCDSCTTLECYRGSADIPPCPTSLTVGRLSQNTYCLSCGNCLFSCPDRNVTIHLRPLAAEARELSRPTLDGAWFMLVLLGVTLFHGYSMTPGWEELLTRLALLVGERGNLELSFALGMLILVALPIPLYLAAASVSTGAGESLRQRIASLAFSTLPLAFAYHLAHNLGHLFRERVDWQRLFTAPLGSDSSLVICEQEVEAVIPVATDWSHLLLQASQVGLVVVGYLLSLQIISRRCESLDDQAGRGAGYRILPMMLFSIAVSTVSLWLLSQDMVMRF